MTRQPRPACIRRRLKIVLFYHSLVSDWNHGNAHFLRGITREFINRGHEVFVYEPINGWSLRHLVAENGLGSLRAFQKAFPGMISTFYDPDKLNIDEVLDSADLVIVHEWNEPSIVSAVGRHRLHNNYLLFFHDTHHRSITSNPEIARLNLNGYDGVLVFGQAIRDQYLLNGWADRVWVWHEAADTSIFHPMNSREKSGDVVWIGNWGDGERSSELDTFLLAPIRELNLKATLFGVRYPPHAHSAILESGAMYKGWVPNYKVPEVFSKFFFTVHIPRRPYVEALPGIPTIRVFEALACGTPLICSPWEDVERLFTPEKDFLVAKDGKDMRLKMGTLLNEPQLARSLGNHGLRTILERHTCEHRVDELLKICATLSKTMAIRS